MFDIATILHPTDLHPSSLAAFQVAKSIASKFDAKIIVLHAAATPALYEDFGADLAPDEEDLAQRSRDLMPLIREDGGEIERLVLVGDAETLIVREAAERRCDPIVMGTTGRDGVGRLSLGSVAGHVSRKASCPVVLVKGSNVTSEAEGPLAAFGNVATVRR